MKKSVLLICFAFAMSSLSGCAQRLADFTVISTKNVDLSQGANFTRGERIEGEDMVPIVLVPLGVPNAKEAVDDAIEKVPGCIGLLDGVLESEYFSFLIGYVKYKVEGTCLVDPQQVAKK
jgi:hypothetical protein